MERVVGDRIVIELAKVGVPVSHNPLMWSECSNFIDYNMNAVNPKSIENPSSDGDCWDNNAAFACLDKFLFREKMLYAACVVGDRTIAELEGRLEQFVMDDVLAEPPSELRFTKPAEHCPRIPIDLTCLQPSAAHALKSTTVEGASLVDTLSKKKTANPLANVDFDAVNPKVTFKEDRMWYSVPWVDSNVCGEVFFSVLENLTYRVVLNLWYTLFLVSQRFADDVGKYSIHGAYGKGST